MTSFKWACDVKEQDLTLDTELYLVTRTSLDALMWSDERNEIHSHHRQHVCCQRKWEPTKRDKWSFKTLLEMQLAAGAVAAIASLLDVVWRRHRPLASLDVNRQTREQLSHTTTHIVCDCSHSFYVILRGGPPPEKECRLFGCWRHVFRAYSKHHTQNTLHTRNSQALTRQHPHTAVTELGW